MFSEKILAIYAQKQNNRLNSYDHKYSHDIIQNAKPIDSVKIYLLLSNKKGHVQITHLNGTWILKSCHYSKVD